MFQHHHGLGLGASYIRFGSKAATSVMTKGAVSSRPSATKAHVKANHAEAARLAILLPRESLTHTMGSG
jgi:hypothetical protein